MTDDPVLKAVQNFMDAVEKRLSANDTELRGLVTEVRGLMAELQTRSAEIPKEGPAGKDGKDGIDGKDGADGKDGTPGERGADGIATREELDSMIEKRFGELQVRSLADSYEGVYQQDKDYTRGQLVTWGGSLFLALADTKARPEQSPDWKLIVKRGADARK